MAAMYMAGWTVAALSKEGGILEGKQQGMDVKQGAEKLAEVILKEIIKRSDKNLVLDLGTVKSNGNLITDTLQLNIGREDYSVLAHCVCSGCICQCPVKDGSCCGGSQGCNNKAVIKEGMETRVLVAWAGDEPVVVGVLAC